MQTKKCVFVNFIFYRPFKNNQVMSSQVNGIRQPSQLYFSHIDQSPIHREKEVKDKRPSPKGTRYFLTHLVPNDDLAWPNCKEHHARYFSKPFIVVFIFEHYFTLLYTIYNKSLYLKTSSCCSFHFCFNNIVNFVCQDKTI